MSKCDCSNPLEQIKALYTELANEPDKDFGWQKGKTNALALGYEPGWLETLPMNVWESCAAVGNPFSIGQILPGQTVVDLGCGAGTDVCVAALLTQDGGKVIGIDCTPAMVAKTRHNASLCGFTHVDVYEADIAKLPIPDNCADVVISNGAINLSVNKSQVLSEARRILRPRGRLQIADMIREDTEDGSTADTNDSWADCVLGTLEADCFLRLIEEAGFQQVSLVSKTGYKTSENTVGALIRAIK
ncbi:MAG: methyltransferase domain-containing protein [Gammaproteobacteria bacterium]|nr:methyltransferase domain-containing protein [Gammaproteobacteria bacterium]